LDSFFVLCPSIFRLPIGPPTRKHITNYNVAIWVVHGKEQIIGIWTLLSKNFLADNIGYGIPTIYVSAIISFDNCLE